MKLKITLVAAMCFALISCSVDNDAFLNTDQSDLVIEIGGGTSPDPDPTSQYTTDLMAGQNMLSGIVNVTADNGVVEVTYSADAEWEIEETHLYIGDLAGLPTNGGGNPKIGHFPYKDTHPAGTTDVTYVGPAIEAGDCVYIAAHAVVHNLVTGDTETAWGAGVPIGGNSWAMMFEFCY